MKAKEIRGCINFRLEVISKKIGIELAIDYAPQYGGYCLYAPTPSHGHSSAGCCFIQPNKRMSGVEMLAYLDGIWNFIIDLQCEKFSITNEK